MFKEEQLEYSTELFLIPNGLLKIQQKMVKLENSRRYLHTCCTKTKTHTLEVVNSVLDASNDTSGVYYQNTVTGQR